MAVSAGHGVATPPSAERVLMEGRVDEAVRMLKDQLAAHNDEGRAYLLLCRAYYSEQQLDDAVHACQTAVRLLPRSSEAHDREGRALGAKADKANPLEGLKLAHAVHDAFEQAFALDPHSNDAANDLAEYYVGAPAVVGGGTDRATALADKIEADLPQLAHRVRGLAAEKDRDFGTAEREFMAAVAVAHRPDAWVSLGGYYKRRKQNDKAVDALRHAIAADQATGAESVDAASYLIDMHAQPELAMKTLQSYLAVGHKSDDAPVIQVHLLISKLLVAKGDRAGAKIELTRALELAADYAPARKALQGL